MKFLSLCGQGDPVVVVGCTRLGFDADFHVVDAVDRFDGTGATGIGCVLEEFFSFTIPDSDTKTGVVDELVTESQGTFDIFDLGYIADGTYTGFDECQGEVAGGRGGWRRWPVAVAGGRRWCILG